MRIRAKTSTFIGVSRGKTMIDSEGSKTLHLRFDLKTLLDHWPSDLYQTHPPLPFTSSTLMSIGPLCIKNTRAIYSHCLII